MEGEWLSSLAAVPSNAEEMRRVRGRQEESAPWQVSRAKICACPFCEAVYATYRPSRLTAGVSSPTIAALTLAAAPALVIVKVAPLLVPPPPLPVQLIVQPLGGGAGGLETVTVADPALASCAAGTVTWICVAVMFMGVRFVCVVVFQCTCEYWVGSELARKFVPIMVSGRSALPAATVLGLMLVTVGTGFGGGKISKATGLESPFVPEPE